VKHKGRQTIVITLTDKTFDRDALANLLPVLVMFEAGWSGPSHIMTPIIADMAKTFSGKITFAKLDVDNEPRTAKTFGVVSVPVLLFFKNGSVVDRTTGAISKSELANKLDRLLQE
jgi:thioredoxin 1